MQNSTLAIQDQNGTDKTFTPVLVSAEQVIFEDLTAPTVAQRKRLVTRPGRFTKTRPTNKPSFSVEVPVVRSVNTVDTVVGTIRLNCEAIYPINATSSEIQEAYAYLVNGLGNALIKAQTRDTDYIT